MGKQSSRIYYNGKDHKDIYYDGYYHSAVYICKESENGKVNCELVWKKIFDENLYIFKDFLAKWPISGINCLTVNMDTKKVYLSNNYTLIDGKQINIMHNPDWISGKKYASFTGKNLYINKELIFNEIFKIDFGVTNFLIINRAGYPSAVNCDRLSKLLTIRKAIIENSEVTSEVVSCNLQDFVNLSGYSISLFRGYNSSRYIYMLARSEGDCMLIQSDIDGNVKILKLENFDSASSPDQRSPIILSAKDEKIYLLSTKVMVDKNTETVFIVNSVTIVDDMKVISTEAIDSWSEDVYSTYINKGTLAANIYNPTVSPMTFVYYRGNITSKNLHSLIINVDNDKISTEDININGFSFCVNLYEDGKIIDTITVSTKFGTDMENRTISLLELSNYFLAGIKAVNYDIKTGQDFNSIIHYTADGWVEGGTHGVFYDEKTQYFYTFYIKNLYTSSENFFIRFRIEEG